MPFPFSACENMIILPGPAQPPHRYDRQNQAITEMHMILESQALPPAHVTVAGLWNASCDSEAMSPRCLLSPPCPAEHSNLSPKEPLLILTVSGIIFLSLSKGPTTGRSDSNLEFPGLWKFLTGILRNHTPSPSVSYHERPQPQARGCSSIDVQTQCTPLRAPSLGGGGYLGKNSSVTGTWNV